MRRGLALLLRAPLAVALIGVASVLGCQTSGSTPGASGQATSSEATSSEAASSEAASSEAASPEAASLEVARPAQRQQVLSTASGAGGSGSMGAAVPALEPLQLRLRELAAKAGGQVGIVVLHVESGRSVAVGEEQWLPLQSVYKLPLAVAVAQQVQAGRLRWDQTLKVTAADRTPGAVANQERWKALPRTVRVRELLEYSLVESDNLASDKLVALIGGRAALVARMRGLGFEPTAATKKAEGLPHHAPALPIAKLLAALQRGDVLPSAQREVLWEMMRRARTGERRIRAGVPAGTPVLEKTGTGRDGDVTNDVGLIALPGDAGHLALAVLISGSSLPPSAQEDLIAEIARAAFNACLPSR